MAVMVLGATCGAQATMSCSSPGSISACLSAPAGGALAVRHAAHTPALVGAASSLAEQAFNQRRLALLAEGDAQGVVSFLQRAGQLDGKHVLDLMGDRRRQQEQG